MSPLGCDPETAYAAACAQEAGWPAEGAAEVQGFDPRRHLPRGRSPRLNRITQLSVAAVEQALAMAGMPPAGRQPAAIGLMVALSRGAAASFQAYMESVRGGAWQDASPTAFPHLVMSSVGGQVSVATGLKGPASTMVGEAEAGLALLGHAATLLRQRPDVAAVVVLAAEELAPLLTELARTADGLSAMPAAEGAVALVLQRRIVATARPLAEVAGWAQSFGENNAARLAGERAGVMAGHPAHCARPDASAGLLAAALAIMALQDNAAPAQVSASSRYGSHAAVVFRPGGPP
jgi:3-oxoacyl-[acyl-carrier-protein] synthase II